MTKRYAGIARIIVFVIYCLEEKWRIIELETEMTLLKNLWNDEQGQDLIEYTLLMAFVALAVAGLFMGAGGNVKGVWASTNNQLAQANGRAS